MNVDLFYAEPPADPIVGVRCRISAFNMIERSATVNVDYILKSGSVDHSEQVELRAEEFNAFALRLIGAKPTKAIAAAVMYRLPNVSDSPAVVVP